MGEGLGAFSMLNLALSVAVLDTSPELKADVLSTHQFIPKFAVHRCQNMRVAL